MSLKERLKKATVLGISTVVLTSCGVPDRTPSIPNVKLEKVNLLEADLLEAEVKLIKIDNENNAQFELSSGEIITFKVNDDFVNDIIKANKFNTKSWGTAIGWALKILGKISPIRTACAPSPGEKCGG